MNLNDIQFMPAHASNYNKGRSMSVKYIVIHYTAGTNDTAKNNGVYFSSAGRKASAHYFVDDNEVIRTVEDGDSAWHCGAKTYTHPECRNSNSIGIEMCSKLSGGVYSISDETVRRTVELTKVLMEKYHIPAENVIRHFDVTGKRCPEPFVRIPALWDDFKERISAPVHDYASVNDIVRELADREIITNKELWLEKLEQDVNAYWLARKMCLYLCR